MPCTSSGNVTKDFASHDHDIINMYPYNISTIRQVMKNKKSTKRGLLVSRSNTKFSIITS